MTDDVGLFGPGSVTWRVHDEPVDDPTVTAAGYGAAARR